MSLSPLSVKLICLSFTDTDIYTYRYTHVNYQETTIDYFRGHKFKKRKVTQLKMNGINVDINRLKKGEVSLGTSIMAVTLQGRRNTRADFTYHNGRIHRQPCTTNSESARQCLVAVGSFGRDTQAVADIMQYHWTLYSLLFGEPSVETAASIFKTLCYENKDYLTAGIIVAGYG